MKRTAIQSHEKYGGYVPPTLRRIQPAKNKLPREKKVTCPIPEWRPATLMVEVIPSLHPTQMMVYALVNSGVWAVTEMNHYLPIARITFYRALKALKDKDLVKGYKKLWFPTDFKEYKTAAQWYWRAHRNPAKELETTSRGRRKRSNNYLPAQSIPKKKKSDRVNVHSPKFPSSFKSGRISPLK